MKIKYIVEQISEEKKLPLWYFRAKTICEITYKNRKISIIAPDKICLQTCDGIFLRNTEAINYIQSQKISNDEQLFNFLYLYDNIGKFDFIYENIQNNATEKLNNDECFTYSDALEFAKEKILNDKFWINTSKTIKKVTTIGVSENWLKYVVYEEKFVLPKRKI